MNQTLKDTLNDLFKEQRFAVIATQINDEPYTNLVTFLIDKDFKKIYFPTSKNSKKFENISKNSKISILIDNRGNTPNDINNAMAVTALGIAKEIKSQKIYSNFLKKHPYLKNFVESSDSAMIEIKIEKYIIVDNFQNVKIINI